MTTKKSKQAKPKKQPELVNLAKELADSHHTLNLARKHRAKKHAEFMQADVALNIKETSHAKLKEKLEGIVSETR